MMKFWRWFRRNDQKFTIALVFVAIAMLLGAALLMYQNKKNPNENAVLKYLGYQPVYVQTGSMEPTMQTNSIVLVKRVDGMEDLEKEDIIMYQVYDEAGEAITITHRIYNIKDDGTIITKGDNNRVADSYTITIDNVLAEVVWIWNGAATIRNLMTTPQGWIMAAVAGLIIVLICVAFHYLFEYLDDKYGINDDEEDSVNDKLLAEDEDDDGEDQSGGKRSKDSKKQKPQLLEEDRNSWQRIYNYKVSEDNLITITGLKPQFYSLTELTVPKEIRQKKVVGLGQFALKNSVATIINLPDTLEFIDKAAFYHCENLLYVEIPDMVKTIAANAFDGCKSLIDIKLPVNLTKIEDKLLNGCVSLDTITINEKVTYIGDSAFYGCDKLTTIYGGKNVAMIKLNAFKTTVPVDTNIITDNEYLMNYNWTLSGRTPTIINDTDLLNTLHEENERLIAKYEAHLEELRIKKEKQFSTKVNNQITKVGEKVKQLKSKKMDATDVSVEEMVEIADAVDAPETPELDLGDLTLTEIVNTTEE